MKSIPVKTDSEGRVEPAHPIPQPNFGVLSTGSSFLIMETQEEYDMMIKPQDLASFDVKEQSPVGEEIPTKQTPVK